MMWCEQGPCSWKLVLTWQRWLQKPRWQRNELLHLLSIPFQLRFQTSLNAHVLKYKGFRQLFKLESRFTGVFCVCWKTHLSFIAQVNTQIKWVLTLLWTLHSYTVKGLGATGCTRGSYQDTPRENCNVNANSRVNCSVFLPALFKQAANAVVSAFRRQMNPFDGPPLILLHHYSILCNKQENDKKAFRFLDKGRLPWAKVKNMFLWVICTMSSSWQSWPFLCFELFPFSTLLIYPFPNETGTFCNLPVQFGGQQERGVILHNPSRSTISKGQMQSNLSPALSQQHLWTANMLNMLSPVYFQLHFWEFPTFALFVCELNVVR